jgi:hypothetical protein
MDEIIRRCREQLAKSTETIEQSREMIALSQRWLTEYHNSVNNKLRTLSVSEDDAALPASAKAIASRK